MQICRLSQKYVRLGILNESVNNQDSGPKCSHNVVKHMQSYKKTIWAQERNTTKWDKWLITKTASESNADIAEHNQMTHTEPIFQSWNLVLHDSGRNIEHTKCIHLPQRSLQHKSKWIYHQHGLLPEISQRYRQALAIREENNAAKHAILHELCAMNDPMPIPSCTKHILTTQKQMNLSSTWTPARNIPPI